MANRKALSRRKATAWKTPWLVFSLTSQNLRRCFSCWFWCKLLDWSCAATMTGMPARQRTPELFKGLHFDHEVVILCVRWYLSYKLSSRDLVNMMGERSVELAHTTILRWVQRYVPEFEKRWNRYARTVGGSWRCDETYIK